MMSQKMPRRLVIYEVIGVVMMITFFWLDELFGWPRLLSGQPMVPPDWSESSMETVVVLLVGIPMLVLTWRLAARMYYLEGFFRICAWCQKIYHGDEWITLTEFAAKGFGKETSHGICPACAKKVMDERKAEGKAAEPHKPAQPCQSSDVPAWKMMRRAR